GISAQANAPAESGLTGSDLLAEAYMTEYAAYYVSCFTSLWGKIYDHVTSEENGILRFSDDELIAAVEEKFTRISYVFIPRDAEDAMALALEANEKIESGADFSEVVEEYGQDANMSSLLGRGYYYVEGEIIDGVADEAASLEPGETSGVIDLGEGYFIIKRLPLDMDYVRSDLGAFRTKYLAYLFNEMVSETAAGLSVKYEKLYSSLTAETVK
ncbi:MAG: peptidylprolyl isomerase, partial [Clostridia bacterium]|nr:peptidylprolyl isomerase [Clostridia bacterium]